MSSEKYNFSSNDLKVNFCDEFAKLLYEEDFSDVTLATADDKQIKAHKVILSSFSPFFKKILKKNPHKNTLIYLKGINYKGLQSIVQFIYLGQAEIEQEDLTEFLTVAKDLQIKGLSDSLKEESLEQCYSNNTGEDESQITFGQIEQREMDLENESIDKDIQLMQGVEINSGLQIKSNEVQEDKAKCDQCEKTFYDFSTMRRHKKNAHTEVRAEWVDQIKTKEISVANIKLENQDLHFNTEFQNKADEYTYKCDECEYTSKTKKYLNTHKLAKHTGVRAECDQCEKTFFDKPTMNRHRKKAHLS